MSGADPDDRGPSAEWLSARHAAMLLGINAKTLLKLGDRRLITTRSVGGLPRKYLKGDCERLLAEAVTPAIERTVGAKQSGGRARTLAGTARAAAARTTNPGR